MPRVAIFDSGIHPGHPHVGQVLASYAATSSSLSAVPGDTLDYLGHGTAVAGAIRHLAPDADLLIVKIFDRSLRTNLETIERGIAWALEQEAEIFNLSLGTSNPAHADTLDAWVKRGGIWVSPAGSAERPSLPGALPGVFQVNADDSLEREQCRREPGTLNFFASPYPRPIPGLPKERNLSGVSFAVANISGMLASIYASAALPLAFEAADALAATRFCLGASRSGSSIR